MGREPSHQDIVLACGAGGGHYVVQKVVGRVHRFADHCIGAEKAVTELPLIQSATLLPPFEVLKRIGCRRQTRRPVQA